MGLDVIELIMEIEETFKVKLPDHEVERMSTVGDLTAYVFYQLRLMESFCLTSRTFYRIRQELLQLRPLTRHQVRPDSRWEALIPASQRQLASSPGYVGCARGQ